MVDSIGSLLSGSGSVTRVAAPAAAPAVDTVVQQGEQGATPASTPADIQLRGLAKAIAAEPPVDADRVAEIRKAIANGSFPILPATIADRLIALSMNWDGHE
jgi:negative regulator of flagellin synthesis FlgM